MRLFLLILFAVFCLHLCLDFSFADNSLVNQSEGIYEWLKSLQLPNGLVESRKGNNFVTVYDNASVAIVFSIQGDFDRAEKIYDFFESRRLTELEQSPGGFGQFRDRHGRPHQGKPHRWLGDNAWLLISLNNYHRLSNTNKYQTLALSLERWILSLQDETDGGLWGGFDKEGKRIKKSTEAILDSFNAIEEYTDFHKDILKYLGDEFWDPSKKLFWSWKEHKKYKYALDMHSWGYCSIDHMTKKILKNVHQYLTTKKATINSKNVTGFCFDLDRDTVWLEGTAQMIVAYQSAGMEKEARKYLREIEKMIMPVSKDSTFFGIPYATNKGTHFGHGRLWKGADDKPAVASSTWYLFAKWGYDPMRLGRDKKIPLKDQFWR